MKLILKPRKVITALEIDNKWLRVVQVKYSGKQKKVSMIAAKEINSLSDDEIKKEVHSLSTQLDIDSRYLIVSIPRAFATTRNLELPSTNPTEIKDMIDLQIGKQTPYTSDEMIRDFQILDSNVDGYSRALLIIVHRDIVDRYLKILEAAYLKPAILGFSSEGLLNWSQLVHKQKIDNEKPYIIIDIDHDKSDFEVILNKKLIFGRSLALGAAGLSEAKERWQKSFIEEVNRSIFAYQNEVMGKELDKILIRSSSGLSKILNKNALADAFGLPVDFTDQLENVPITQESLNSYNSLADNNLSFSGLLGLALTFGEQNLDFIPQELQIERSVKEKGKDLYVMGVFLVFILIVVSAIFWGRIYNKERYLKQLKTQLVGIQDKTKELNNMVRVIEVVYSRISTKDLSLNLIYEIHQLISPEIHLVSLSFDGKDLLTLRGTSNSMSEIFNFVNKLEESDYFKNVNTKYVTKHKVQDRELSDFEISCPLEDKYKNVAF